jgi:L,D-transpeptidase ErfK/SrfK
MYPEDIESLFPQVPLGTAVQIVNQPVKIGWFFDTLYIEVHPPLEEDAPTLSLVETAMDLINAAREQRAFVLHGQALNKALAGQSGIPLPIAEAIH